MSPDEADLKAKMDAVVDSLPPERAAVELLKLMFMEVAGLDGRLTALAAVLGAVAGRCGLKSADLRKLLEDSERE